MVKVYISSVIEAPTEKVWALVRDFNGLPNWHLAIADSRIESNLPADKIGCIRNFNLKEGGNIREQLLSLSDYDHACTYRILASPLGVENYVATIKLTPITDGNRSFAEWSAEFDCPPEREKELAKTVGDGVFQGGFNGLKQRFAGKR